MYRRGIFSALPAAALLATSCGASDLPLSQVETAPLSRAPDPAPIDRVVLITVDGTRWQEIFQGVDRELAARAHLPESAIVDARHLLPNFYSRVVDRGVAIGAPGGATIDASGPSFVSLPGYREIFSGRPALRCTSNDCPPLDEPTLLDELRARDGADGIAAISSWETIEQAVSQSPDALTLSTGRHGGRTRDRVRVSLTAARGLDRAAGPYPGHADYRRDRDTAAIALEYLAARRPRFLAIGLGDTDEYAHRNDYRGYLQALADADDFIGRLFALLDELGDDRTMVLITADHGRATDFRDHGADPASQKVWLLAAGGSIPPRGIVAGDSRYRLADIAPTLRRLLDLRADPSPRAGRPIEELLPDPVFASH
jgi:hypothetical protein